MVKASNTFEAEMAKGETIAFCQSMVAKARSKGDSSDAEVWGFMQVIFGKSHDGYTSSMLPSHALLIIHTLLFNRG